MMVFLVVVGHVYGDGADNLAGNRILEVYVGCDIYDAHEGIAGRLLWPTIASVARQVAAA